MAEIYASASNLDAYHEWMGDEEQDVGALVARLRADTTTEHMERGRAFAKAMEEASEGEHSVIRVDGYTFAFTGDFSIPNTPRREMRGRKDYGGIAVGVRCDRFLGRTVMDDKSTQSWGATINGMNGYERYMAKFAWRYYLDIFQADRFVWNVWEVKSIPDPSEKLFEVYAMHELEQFRYAGMEQDCKQLAHEYRDFALSRGWEEGRP